MSNLKVLRSLIEAGTLCSPNSQTLSSIDLVKALHGQAVHEQNLELLNPRKNTVFVIIDGMGKVFTPYWPSNGFFSSHLKRDLLTVFPSTTATALSSIHTGKWPGEHCIPGWWTYLEDQSLSVTTLLYQERFSEKPLTDFGLSPTELFISPALFQKGVLHYAVLPHYIVNSAFTNVATGYAKQVGYENIQQGIESIVNNIKQAKQTSHTYFYLPQLDSLVHKQGVHCPAAQKLVGELDGLIGELFDRLPADTRVVVTADHGMIDVQEQDKYTINHDDSLVDLLKAPPIGEPRVPIFHVKPGSERVFEQEISSRMGDVLILIKPAEAESLKLFGPNRISPIMKKRLGTYIGIFKGRSILKYVHINDQVPAFRGYHAGLDPDEMIIPLIAAYK